MVPGLTSGTGFSVMFKETMTKSCDNSHAEASSLCEVIVPLRSEAVTGKAANWAGLEDCLRDECNIQTITDRSLHILDRSLHILASSILETLERALCHENASPLIQLDLQSSFLDTSVPTRQDPGFCPPLYSINIENIEEWATNGVSQTEFWRGYPRL